MSVATEFPRLPSTALATCLVSALALALGSSPLRAQAHNDYPTAVRADYVFGCMKSNGETREALEKCSCSIDVIASLLPYEDYVTAETFLSMAQVPGEKGVIFRSSAPARTATGNLRRAQAEAEIRCF